MKDRQQEYLAYHHKKLGLLRGMWSDPRVQLYNDDKLPRAEDLARHGSVFLAGPTSRHQTIECNWRCDAVALLRIYGFVGWIFCPEPRGKEYEGDFTERAYIHEWESSRLLKAKHIAFWIPRKADELLGLNTNLELGFFLGMLFAHTELSHPTDPMPSRFDWQHVHVGHPLNAERMGLPRHYTEIAGVQIHSRLFDLCKAIAEIT